MTDGSPLVSVICLCYNQRDYVAEAIASVLNQTYQHIELIVVDDASTDGSQQVIGQLCEENESIIQVLLEKNHGNCRAFNTAWVKASGKYIIDLAADDLLHETRVARGVAELEAHGEEYGIHFTDARLIDRNGASIGQHLTREFLDPVPQGMIFKEVLSRYFINPVSMMMTDKMLKSLGGYDEELAYEDFDLWVRSAREFAYCYSPEVLVSKRRLNKSHSSSQYKMGSQLLRTTFRVCQKAFELCRTNEEYTALLIRVNYELKRAVFSFNLLSAFDLYTLRQKVLRQPKE